MAWYNPFKPKPKPAPTPTPKPSAGERKIDNPYSGGGSGGGLVSPPQATGGGGLVRRGGGGSSGGVTQTGAEAQARLEEVLASQAKAQAAAKSQAEAQAALQAKIQSQRIQGQVEAAKETQIKQNVYIQSLTAREGANAEISLPKGSQQSYEERVGDKEITYYEPIYGTLQTDSMGNQEAPFRKITTTRIKEQEKKDFLAGLPFGLIGASDKMKVEVLSSNVGVGVSKKYQAKVDSGELTVKDAQQQAEEDYGKQLSKTLSKIDTSDAIAYKSSSQQRKETAANFGKSVVSLNPLGAVILGADALNKQTLYVDNPKTSSLSYLGFKGNRGEKFFGSEWEAAMYIGVGALGAMSIPFKYARQYDAATLAALKSKPFTSVGIETVGKDSSVVNLVVKRSVKGAKETVSLKATGFGAEGGKFSVGGRATSITEYKSFLNTLRKIDDKVISSESVKLFGKGKSAKSLLKVGDDLVDIGQITTRGEYGIVREGYQIDKIKIKPSKPSRWSILLPEDKVLMTKPKIKLKGSTIPDSLTTGRFGGQSKVSTINKDFTGIASGKITKLRVDPITGQAREVVSLNQVGVLKKLAGGLDDVGLDYSLKGTTNTLSKYITKMEAPTQLGKSIQTFGQAVAPSVSTYKVPSTIKIGIPVITKQIQQPKGNVQSMKPFSLQLQSPKVESITESITKVKPLLSTRSKAASRTAGKTNLNFTTTSAQESLQRQSTKQVTKQTSSFKAVNPILPILQSNISPVGAIVNSPFRVPLPFFWFRNKPIPVVGKERGFTAEAYDKGKWLTLNKQPLTRSAAKDLGARATDNTTSKRFRIRPSKKGKAISSGDMYFTTNQNKFRPYKIRQGTKVPLRETFIEKTSFGIDTRGEKQGLSLAKWKAQQSGNIFAPTIKKRKGVKKNGKTY